VIANLYKDNLVLGNDLKVPEQKTNPAKTVQPVADPAPIPVPQQASQQLPQQGPSQASQQAPQQVPPQAPTKAPAQVSKPMPVESPSSKPSPAASPASATEPPKQWFLGNNGKQIGILIKDPQVAFISDEQLQFLSNILNACKLNLGDVAVINMARHPIHFSELKQQLQSKFLILFDLTTADLQLPFNIPLYQVQAYDHCSILLASSLTKMLGDSQEAKLEKSKLWVSLKNMFQL